MKILHAFADTGAENPCLSKYGEVIRVGLNAEPNDYSEAIQANVLKLPFKEGVEFDIGWFHPPCTKWSMMPDADKDGEAKNWIPTARRKANSS